MSLHAPQVERKYLVENNSYFAALKARTSKFGIAVYTGTRAIAKLNTIQSHIRDVAEDPK